jgi:hypothetical protein
MNETQSMQNLEHKCGRNFAFTCAVQSINFIINLIKNPSVSRLLTSNDTLIEFTAITLSRCFQMPEIIKSEVFILHHLKFHTRFQLAQLSIGLATKRKKENLFPSKLQLSAHFFWPLVNPDALHSAAKYNFII